MLSALILSGRSEMLTCRQMSPTSKLQLSGAEPIHTTTLGAKTWLESITYSNGRVKSLFQLQATPVPLQ
jgi:hypothetical protein